MTPAARYREATVLEPSPGNAGTKGRKWLSTDFADSRRFMDLAGPIHSHVRQRAEVQSGSLNLLFQRFPCFRIHLRRLAQRDDPQSVMAIHLASSPRSRSRPPSFPQPSRRPARKSRRRAGRHFIYSGIAKEPVAASSLSRFFNTLCAYAHIFNGSHVTASGPPSPLPIAPQSLAFSFSRGFQIP